MPGRILAISDIHGNKRTFLALLDRIALTKNDELYLLGDFIDRGPDSKGVIDAIWKLQDQHYRVYCLKGNHEDMLFKGIAEKGVTERSVKYGLMQTLRSFNVENAWDIPVEYTNFLKELPVSIEKEQYIFVHAGLNMHVPDPMQDEVAMMWSRGWESTQNESWLRGRMVVYGHTPTERVEIENQLQVLSAGKYLRIDNGCFHEFQYKKSAYSHLCAADLTNRLAYFERRIDEINQ
jgi:serine/threonine protein phosphatase 1